MCKKDDKDKEEVHQYYGRDVVHNLWIPCADNYKWHKPESTTMVLRYGERE